MFDPVFRRFLSVDNVLEGLTSSSGGVELYQYLIRSGIHTMASDTEKFEALLKAPGAMVRNYDSASKN